MLCEEAPSASDGTREAGQHNLRPHSVLCEEAPQCTGQLLAVRPTKGLWRRLQRARLSWVQAAAQRRFLPLDIKEPSCEILSRRRMRSTYAATAPGVVYKVFFAETGEREVISRKHGKWLPTCKVLRYDTALRFRSADERCTHEDHDFSRSSTFDVVDVCTRVRALYTRGSTTTSRLYGGRRACCPLPCARPGQTAQGHSLLKVKNLSVTKAGYYRYVR